MVGGGVGMVWGWGQRVCAVVEAYCQQFADGRNESHDREICGHTPLLLLWKRRELSM